LIDFANLAMHPIVDLMWSASNRIYWLYLACAAVIALVVHLCRAPNGSRRYRLAFSFPRAIVMHPSSIADCGLWLLNSLLLLLVIPAVWISGDTVKAVTAAALSGVFGIESLGLVPGTSARIAYTIANILALDGGLFFAHYLHHRVPFLWELHKVHHSAEVLTPITVFRVHPIEAWINLSVVGTVVGFAAGIFGFVFGAPPAIFAVNGINLVMFVFLIAGYHLRHSHVWVMFPRPIARHISSPAMHLIHHSRDPKHADKNFAQIFNFWDRLTGTLYLPTAQEAVAFGLHDGEHLEFRGVVRLYLRPLRNIAVRLSRGRVRQS